MTLTRADAWQVRRTEQDRLAAMKVERRLVFALHGEAGADRAQELDYLMALSLERIANLTDAITDWTGACLEGEPCSP
jgi:hypothetical protein